MVRKAVVCLCLIQGFVLVSPHRPPPRVKRDVPGYAAPQPSYQPEPVYHAPKAHGRVGPVYTFVKTDPQANFKWGVRHRAGVQYGKRDADTVLSREARSPQGPEGPLPIPREGSYGPDQYFQYINVPAHKTFEWGYKRGNPKHNREEYLSQKDHTFKAKLKWNDGYAGHGEHYFDFNHGDSYKPAPYKTAPAYSPPKPAYAGSETDEQFVEAPNSFAKRDVEQTLSRQARRISEEQDSYQSAPFPSQYADARDDSAGSSSGPPAYGPPAAAPHAGPDHVDYGAYTGGYGAFGWYTDHPVLLGPGHRRKRQDGGYEFVEDALGPGGHRRRRRQAPGQLADEFQIQPSRFAQAARRRIQEDTAANAAYGAAPVGRVKIQVYRGPSKGDYDFAPWGYYNTQPADLAIHH